MGEGGGGCLGQDLEGLIQGVVETSLVSNGPGVGLAITDEGGEVGVVVEDGHIQGEVPAIGTDVQAGGRIEEVEEVVAGVVVLADPGREAVEELGVVFLARRRNGPRLVAADRLFDRDLDVENLGLGQDPGVEPAEADLVAVRRIQGHGCTLGTATGELDDDGVTVELVDLLGPEVVEDDLGLVLEGFGQLVDQLGLHLGEGALGPGQAGRTVEALEQPVSRVHDLAIGQNEVAVAVGLFPVDEGLVVLVEELDEHQPGHGIDEALVRSLEEDPGDLELVPADLVQIDHGLDVRIVVQVDEGAETEVVVADLGTQVLEEVANLRLAGSRKSEEDEGFDDRSGHGNLVEEGVAGRT